MGVPGLLVGIVVLYCADVGPAGFLFVAYTILCFPMSGPAYVAYLVTAVLLFDPTRDDIVIRAWLGTVWLGAALVQVWALAVVVGAAEARQGRSALGS